MHITVIGRGNVGGGLARFWEEAGHTVTALGKDGGDASAADVIVVAVPSGSIGEALSRVTGIEGKPTIDATNAFAGRNEEFESLAAEVKEIAEQLVRDAGYDPVYAGGLDKARAVEDHIGLLFSITQEVGGRVFYRIAKPGEL